MMTCRQVSLLLFAIAFVDATPPVYWGGKVMVNSIIQPIFIGNYTKKAETVSFYTQLIKSQLMTVMTEYYQIEASGTKTYINIPQTVLPAVDATGATDSSGNLIEAEQGAQIIDSLQKRNALPATTPDTVYVFHFGEDQTTGGLTDCTATVAYHECQLLGDTRYVFSVIKPCAAYHFGNPVGFDAITASASHELFEILTDPFWRVKVGWTGENPGEKGVADLEFENGDVCNGLKTVWRGTDGVMYTAQKIYSVLSGGCVGFEDLGDVNVATVVTRTATSGAGRVVGWCLLVFLSILFS